MRIVIVSKWSLIKLLSLHLNIIYSIGRPGVSFLI